MHAYPQVPPQHVGEALGTVVVHARGLLHWPVELHVCTPLPEHCVAPGVHTPAHWPLMQTYEQGEGFDHVAAAAAGLDPVARSTASRPASTSPVHVPELHANAHAAPLFCQVPVPSQVCGC